jgi:PhnB protein
VTKSIPDGWHSITPRLVTHNPAGLVEFLRRAFDASGDFQTERPSVMQIGDSRIMVSSVGPRSEMTAFFYLYVIDADSTYRQALAAGAVSLEEPQDVSYGDRRAMVQDPFGNIWQIATPKK